jgi:PKD repeat protein
MRACLAVAVLVCGLLGLAGCGAGSGGGSNAAPALKPPVANAGGPYTGTVGTAVSFSGAASSDPQGEALTYAWNFGDNATGTGVSPGHAYATTGTYTVSLTVTDTSNLTNSATSKVTISIDPLSDVGLTGLIYGGQTPIVGAHVYLFAANTTGYGGAGIAASNSNASVSLLSAAETGTTDAVGAYVLSGSNGGFSLTGDYTCSSGQQLYLYALGGTNSAAGLMAAIGSCPGSGGPAIFATVNEVTTIAAAYAFAGFATDATHVSSSGTALAKTGIANAFANAANLASIAAGAALATTPAGNGTVPQAEINTLANILAVCVNTSSSCSSLLATATTDGTATGTMATDTATAAINIAHHPGANTAALYGMATANPSFAPGLSTQPNDFVVAIQLSGGGLVRPSAVAIDSLGNAWVTNSWVGYTPGIGSSVSELSTSGAALSPSGGYDVGGNMESPLFVAIDPSGNVWVMNGDGGYGGVTELSNSGSILRNLNWQSVNPLGCIEGDPSGMAIDGSGNVWIVSGYFTSNQCVVKVSSTGSLLFQAYGYTGGGLNEPTGLAIDGSGNAWAANYGSWFSEFSSTGAALSGTYGYTNASLGSFSGIAIDASGSAWAAVLSQNSLVKISNAGSYLSGTNGYTGGGLCAPYQTAIDGAGNVWVTDVGQRTYPSPEFDGSVSEFSNAGLPISGANGYMGASFGSFPGALSGPSSIAVDGSGDVWTTSHGPLTIFVTEFIGAATPVITPIAAGLPATPTADGSSKLGTRP